MEVATPWGLFHWGETNGVFTFLSLLYAIPRKSQAVRGKFTKTLSLCGRALLFPKSKNFRRPAWACPARQRCFAPGLRLPASASLSLASCWPRPQQLLPVSATGGGRRRCSYRGEALAFRKAYSLRQRLPSLGELSSDSETERLSYLHD